MLGKNKEGSIDYAAHLIGVNALLEAAHENSVPTVFSTLTSEDFAKRATDGCYSVKPWRYCSTASDVAEGLVRITSLAGQDTATYFVLDHAYTFIALSRGTSPEVFLRNPWGKSVIPKQNSVDEWVKDASGNGLELFSVEKIAPLLSGFSYPN